MIKLNVNLKERSYPIYIGKNILNRVGIILKKRGYSGKVGIVTNPKIVNLYGEKVFIALKNTGYDVHIFEIPDGERYKSIKWVSYLYDKLISKKFERFSPLLALGGGVIGDITGFVSATYLRGIPYIQIPTTLLSQVDSSIGGKTAVNHRMGKNLIGAFYQPRFVLIDIAVLNTLDHREFLSGISEIIKYGVIKDKKLFFYIEKNLKNIFKLEDKSILHIIRKSCSIKAKIVETDEKEEGLRMVLNFGHSFAHAIEKLTNYRKYTHGEAVAIGMVVATKLSFNLGMCSEDVYIKIKSLISACGLPTELPKFNKNKYLQKLGLDKKIRNGEISFILTEDIGCVNFKKLKINELLENLN